MKKKYIDWKALSGYETPIQEPVTFVIIEIPDSELVEKLNSRVFAFEKRYENVNWRARLLE